MSELKPEEFGDVFEFTNKSDDLLMIVIEPWIAEISVPRNSNIRVQGWSEQPGTFEWDSDDAIIWGWPGSSARALVNGKQVWQSEFAFPPLPEGMSVRSFFQIVGFSEGDAE